MTERIVVIGASLAGLRAAEGLRHHGFDGELVIVGDEPHRPYDRPPLSKQVLTGKVDAGATGLLVPAELEAEWLLATSAVGLHPGERRVLLAGREGLAYDGLVLATGAKPRHLPGAEPGPGVHYLRTLDDALALRRDIVSSQALVVIGAGFIGLEVACSAQEMGVPVVVLEAAPVPLERALGVEMGRAVMAWHASKGVEVRAGTSVESIRRSPSGRPEAVVLNDATVVPADTIVVGVGVAPATGWLEGSGLELSNGVLCDDRLRVLADGRPRPDLVAAGDVARWHHPLYGEPVRIEHWNVAAEAGQAAALTLLQGDAAPPFAPVPYFWSDQHGMKLQFVGRADPGDDVAFLEGSFEEDRFLAAYGREGQLVGALGLRRPARVMSLQKLIAERAPFPPPQPPLPQVVPQAPPPARS